MKMDKQLEKQINDAIWRKNESLVEVKKLQQEGMSSAGICMSKILEELE